MALAVSKPKAPTIFAMLPPAISYHRVAAGASSRKRKRAVEYNQLHVLLVDDDDTTRSTHTNLFRRHSCKVSLVPDTLEVFGFLGLFDDPGPPSIPDMIVADFDLPGMNGYVLLQLIKATPGMEHLQVVVLLPDKIWRHRDKFMLAGALTTFKKPLTEENVMTLMNGRSRGNVCESLVSEGGKI